MKLGFSPQEELFRAECAEWLNGQMAGEFRDIKGVTQLTAMPERRKEWEQQLGEHRWSCIGWPEQWGGRDASLAQQAAALSIQITPVGLPLRRANSFQSNRPMAAPAQATATQDPDRIAALVDYLS